MASAWVPSSPSEHPTHSAVLHLTTLNSTGMWQQAIHSSYMTVRQGNRVQALSVHWEFILLACQIVPGNAMAYHFNCIVVASGVQLLRACTGARSISGRKSRRVCLGYRPQLQYGLCCNYLTSSFPTIVTLGVIPVLFRQDAAVRPLVSAPQASVSV